MALFLPFVVGAAVTLIVDQKLTKWKRNFRDWVEDIKYQDYLKHRDDPEFLHFKQQWAEFQVEGKLYELYKETRLHRPSTGKEATDTPHVKLVQP